MDISGCILLDMMILCGRYEYEYTHRFGAVMMVICTDMLQYTRLNVGQVFFGLVRIILSFLCQLLFLIINLYGYTDIW